MHVYIYMYILYYIYIVRQIKRRFRRFALMDSQTSSSSLVHEMDWKSSTEMTWRSYLLQNYVLQNVSSSLKVLEVSKKPKLNHPKPSLFACFAARGPTSSLRLAYFGLAEVRRFEIGAALWAGHWETAAHLLLTANRAESLRDASKDRVQGQ